MSVLDVDHSTSPTVGPLLHRVSRVTGAGTYRAGILGEYYNCVQAVCVCVCVLWYFVVETTKVPSFKFLSVTCCIVHCILALRPYLKDADPTQF